MKYLNKSLSFFAFLSALLFTAQRSFSQIEFIENKGQWDKRVTFKTNIGSGTVFLQKQGFTIVQHDEKDIAAMKIKLHGHVPGTGQPSGDKAVIHSHAYTATFLNGNPNCFNNSSASTSFDAEVTKVISIP